MKALVVIVAVLCTIQIATAVFLVVKQQQAAQPTKSDEIIVHPRAACVQQQIHRAAEQKRRNFEEFIETDANNFRYAADKLCANWERFHPDEQP